MKTLISALALAILAQSAFGIRNGDPVRHGKFLPVGELNNGCTATLVAANIILTAAHCVRRDAWNNEFELDGQGIAYGERIRILNADNPEELALIKLDREYDVPELYPFWLKPLRKGTRATAVGFGERGGDQVPDLDAFVPSKFEGQLRFSGNEKVRGRQISGRKIESDVPMLRFEPADERGQLPLPGDSGGPVLVEENGQTYFAGVASFITTGGEGKTTAESARLVYYVPVQKHCEWLLTTVDDFKGVRK